MTLLLATIVKKQQKEKGKKRERERPIAVNFDLQLDKVTHFFSDRSFLNNEIYTISMLTS